MLTHYTRTADAVCNILAHGFAWVPNRRRLADVLLPQHDYTKREPQQFGMISFTDLESAHASRHREVFGAFGIMVSEQWSAENNAQRVIYIDNHGPVTDALRTLFDIGYDDVTKRIEYPDDAAWLMAYENKHVGGSISGSHMWANLLQLWEYLEPASQAAQREWRIVNPMPRYGLSEDKCEIIAAVSPPKGWAQYMNVVPIARMDVMGLVSPAAERDRLRRMLPDRYADIHIIETHG